MKYTFISAERAGLSREENNKRTKALRRYLLNQGLEFVDVCGVYCGVEEMSFRISGRFPEAQDAAEYFEQESYLFVDDSDQAYLIYTETGKTEHIGTFRRVHEFEARKRAGYSIIENEFYLAV